MKLASVVSVCFAVSLATTVSIQAQSAAGTIHGTVLDPSGAAIPGAAVEIRNPVSQYDQQTQADSQGVFQFTNIPFNNYHVTAAASGFQASEQDVSVRSALPIDVKFSLKIGAATTNVTVTDAGDLVETVPTTHTDIDRDLFDKLPLESTSSSLS